jgi:hypothetical protein
MRASHDRRADPPNGNLEVYILSSRGREKGACRHLGENQRFSEKMNRASKSGCGVDLLSPLLWSESIPLVLWNSWGQEGSVFRLIREAQRKPLPVSALPKCPQLKALSTLLDQIWSSTSWTSSFGHCSEKTEYSRVLSGFLASER